MQQGRKHERCWGIDSAVRVLAGSGIARDGGAGGGDGEEEGDVVEMVGAGATVEGEEAGVSGQF